MQSRQPRPREQLEPELPERRAGAALGGQAWRGVPTMEIEKEFHRLDQAASWAAIYQVRGSRPARLLPPSPCAEAGSAPSLTVSLLLPGSAPPSPAACVCAPAA